MRKHSARKWLHFVLDLLPILVLPIFAIYEINHDQNTPITINDTENLLVDFNQVRNTTYGDIDNDNYQYATMSRENTPLTYGDIYYVYLEYFFYDDNVSTLWFKLGNPSFADFGFNLPNSTVWTNISYRGYLTSHGTDSYTSYFQKYSSGFVKSHFAYQNLQIINLTQMFGSGNEPSLTEFDSIWQYHNYSYTESTEILLSDYSTVVYDNTDIGSQMMYALYKPVKEYFNFNNVFNFGDIYHWFELNMFGGNAPMPIFIVWNIIVYQFLMDLMFLVYSIFMFIIDFTSECLERCFSFSRHGGSR